MTAAIVAVAATMAGARAIDRPHQADLIARLDAYVAEGMRTAGDPGAAIVVVDDSGVIHCRGFGHDAHGAPITCRTRFVVASLTKGFTALAVMREAERGTLHLEMAARAYLPWFRPNDMRPITVSDLLLMRSGIATSEGKRWLASRDADPEALERRVRELNGARLFAAPGTAFAYSNANYDVLGAILQRHGRAYEELMRERVLLPLGMRHATFARDANVRGFTRVFGFPVPALSAPADRGDVAAAGLVTDPLELGRYLSAHLDAGATWSARVLSSDGWQHLHASPPRSPYAAGWYDTVLADGEHVYRHDGLAPDFHAFAVFVPSRHIGAALLVNASQEPDGGRRDAFDRGIGRLLLDRTPESRSPLPQDLPLRLLVLGGLIAAVWDARRAVSGRDRRAALQRGAIALALVAAMRFVVLPQMGDSLAVGLVYGPDLTGMLVALLAVVVVTAGIGVARAFRPNGQRSRPREGASCV